MAETSSLEKLIDLAKSDPMVSIRFGICGGGTQGSVSYSKHIPRDRNQKDIINLCEAWDIDIPNKTMEEATEKLWKRIQER